MVICTSGEIKGMFLSSVADGGVYQFDWWRADCNEVEISFGEMQNICEGTVALDSMLCRLAIKAKWCV